MRSDEQRTTSKRFAFGFGFGSASRTMAGASGGGAEHPNEPRNEWLNLVALALWLFSIHLNLLVVFIILCFLPNPWAISALVLWLSQSLLPLYTDTPFANRVARFICKYAPTHFPIETHIEDIDALDPKRAYVFAVEPHSVLPISIIALTKHYGLMPVKKMKALASSAIFWTPVLRHVWSWLGLVPASRKCYKDLLQDGYSTILIPGGVQECLYLEYGHETIFLKKRFGFVRGAIEAGAPLVPCFCFGQSDVYHYWKPSGQWYAHLSRAIGFTPLIFWGMYGTPIPYPNRMYLVVGKPIDVEKNSNPSHEQISEVLKKFVAAMEDLFEKHKLAAGYKDTTLTVR
ncbi:diacylglycerol O-acyltransferase 2, plant [Marchantia polymorpha subsp. ruderalis]|uniref:Acyltransferase n=2 Tax=Marchantia polymorpha TaxID=3197 RepID=A0A176WLR3_MARPO|nr:hypothetical protein AXG93_3005s1250 [Marchantia polymorpha subsp. ruderalis]PTQ43996.1 hypothetical protein MARPO_0022s0098 [Marchantia polymorpha]BBN04408.1 hypothetical protein Mp_3g04330 [Marchantia polymorpha subsp. ruderalis]|eukprot:PTQ43996.1 hypothetical protein MARPO_0022s0098 [Marchantia polymorpha]